MLGRINWSCVGYECYIYMSEILRLMCLNAHCRIKLLRGWFEATNETVHITEVENDLCYDHFKWTKFPRFCLRVKLNLLMLLWTFVLLFSGRRNNYYCFMNIIRAKLNVIPSTWIHMNHNKGITSHILISKNESNISFFPWSAAEMHF